MRIFSYATAFLLGFNSAAGALTYDVNLSGFDTGGSSIVGTITYNTLGAVTLPDAWHLTLFSPELDNQGYAPLVLDSSDSFEEVSFLGSGGISASSTELTFDMSSGSTLYFHNFGGISGSELGLCIGQVTAPNPPNFVTCYQNQGVAGFGFISESGMVDFTELSGTVTIGTVSPIPLPASLPLMLSAIGIIGFVRTRRT